MLAGGEDPRFIARRLMILASEDVGNAAPQGLPMAAAAFDAAEKIGMPEVQIILAQVTTYLACAPKSNASYKAIAAAMKDVQEKELKEVPIHLRDANYQGAKELGHGVDYRYAHSDPSGHVVQEYMPDPTQYYFPTNRGVEARFKEHLDRLKKKKEGRSNGE